MNALVLIFWNFKPNEDGDKNWVALINDVQMQNSKAFLKASYRDEPCIKKGEWRTWNKYKFFMQQIFNGNSIRGKIYIWAHKFKVYKTLKRQIIYKSVPFVAMRAITIEKFGRKSPNFSEICNLSVINYCQDYNTIGSIR